MVKHIVQMFNENHLVNLNELHRILERSIEWQLEQPNVFQIDLMTPYAFFLRVCLVLHPHFLRWQNPLLLL